MKGERTMNEYELLLRLFKMTGIRFYYEDVDINYWLQAVSNARFLSEQSKCILQYLINMKLYNEDKKTHKHSWLITFLPFGREDEDFSLSYSNQVKNVLDKWYSISNDKSLLDPVYFEHIVVIFKAYDDAENSLPSVTFDECVNAIVDFHYDYNTTTKIQKWIEKNFWKEFTKKCNTVTLSCGIVQKNWSCFKYKGLEGLFDNPQYICEAMRNVSSDFKQLKEQGKFGTPDFMIEYKMWGPFDSNDVALDRNETYW